jgi:hypothetical protein
MAVVCLDEHVAFGMVQHFLGYDLRHAKFGKTRSGRSPQIVGAPGRHWLHRLRVLAVLFRLFSRGLKDQGVRPTFRLAKTRHRALAARGREHEIAFGKTRQGVEDFERNRVPINI